MSLTTDPNDPKLKEGQKNEKGQHEIYLVLSDEERAKGFVRPVRDAYKHIGKMTPDIQEKGKLFTLDELHEKDPTEYNNERIEKFKNWGHVAYIEYSEEYKKTNGSSAVVGQFIDQKEYDAMQNKEPYVGGCGSVTTMGDALSETYARDPKFYGATFCCGCNKHIRVEEFQWVNDGQTVGS